jgi:hypothetical protein
MGSTTPSVISLLSGPFCAPAKAGKNTATITANTSLNVMTYPVIALAPP